METSNVLAVIIFIALGVKQGECMEFIVRPQKGIEGVTKMASLACRTEIEAPSFRREIILVQITRGDEESVALLRGSGNISYGEEANRRIEGVGQINSHPTPGGYLNVSIHYPSHEDTGIYKCHVVYLDDMGVANHDSRSAYLDVDKSSLSKMDERVKSLESMVHAMSRKILELNATYQSEKKESVHAFSAAVRREKYYIRNGITLKFDQVITSQGQGYNPSNGHFTAPVDGVYAFFLVIEMEGKAGAGFSLQTTGNREFSRLYVEDADVGDQSSVSSVVTLRAGEEIRVKVAYKTDESGLVYHNKYSLFSGFLVKPL